MSGPKPIAAHEQRKERHLNSLQRGVKHKDHDANSQGETAEDANRVGQPVKTYQVRR